MAIWHAELLTTVIFLLSVDTFIRRYVHTQDEGATSAIDTESIDGTLGGDEIPVVEPSGVVDLAPPLASSTDQNGDPTNSPETSEPTAPPEGKVTALGELRYSFLQLNVKSIPPSQNL